MTTSLTRAAGLCALLATTCLVSPALAQSAPGSKAPAPVREVIDGNGVDLTTGKLSLTRTDMTIGPDDHRGLRYIVARHGDNLIATISGAWYNPTVSFGGSSEQFGTTSNGYVSAQGSGSSLTQAGSIYIYTLGIVEVQDSFLRRGLIQAP